MALEVQFTFANICTNPRDGCSLKSYRIAHQRSNVMGRTEDQTGSQTSGTVGLECLTLSQARGITVTKQKPILCIVRQLLYILIFVCYFVIWIGVCVSVRGLVEGGGTNAHVEQLLEFFEYLITVRHFSAYIRNSKTYRRVSILIR